MAGAWEQAVLALELLRTDPGGLGGLHLRARAGPVRDRLLALLPRSRKLNSRLDDITLFGGADLSATLATGRLVRTRGLIAEAPALLLVPMAERMTPAAAARLARLIEGGHCLVALDEGAEPDETIPGALADRLGLSVSLETCALADCDAPATLRSPTGSPEAVALDGDAAAVIVALAARLGIASLRAPLAALRAARAAAALEGRDAVSPDDLAVAVALVLAPRATQALEVESSSQEQPEPPQEPPPPAEGEPEARELEDLLVEAARVAMQDWRPPEGPRQRTARGAGSGARRADVNRGKPLPSRAGRRAGSARIDVIATLRAAAPWQRLRQGGEIGARPVFRMDDLRLRRYEQRSDRVLIFAVDASGSTAYARLAEAKGAVELLLGGAYVRRDRIALVVFRGAAAEVLLPPTRSLVQAKRRLAALPGGGATPLAHGLRAALELAEGARGHGMTPSLALLTDGRTNVALNGQHDRAAARHDAQAMARSLGSRTVPGIVIDTGLRPDPQLSALAGLMAADYLPLPRAQAAAISAAVAQAFDRS